VVTVGEEGGQLRTVVVVPANEDLNPETEGQTILVLSVKKCPT